VVRWLALSIVLLTSGCKMMAPIHTWNAAPAAKPGVVRVAVSPVGVASRAIPTHQGNGIDKLQQVAQRLQASLLETVPHPSPLLVAIPPTDLAKASEIQLVSYDDQPSEAAALGAARRVNADLLLQANIMFANLEIPQETKRKALMRRLFGRNKPVQHISVHWTVVDVPTGQRVFDKTIETTDIDIRKAALKNTNDITPHETRLISLASYRGWQLVSSSPKASDIAIDLPWFWVGASQVRKGNGYAKQGRWDLAEKEWQNVADQHPTNAAAWHNLALAAVAREDFELAKSRLKHADSIARGRAPHDTAAWIEEQERQYKAVMTVP
jgi:tetratricopeptide (TPR) repeat protein